MQTILITTLGGIISNLADKSDDPTYLAALYDVLEAVRDNLKSEMATMESLEALMKRL